MLSKTCETMTSAALSSFRLVFPWISRSFSPPGCTPSESLRTCLQPSSWLCATCPCRTPCPTHPCLASLTWTASAMPSGGASLGYRLPSSFHLQSLNQTKQRLFCRQLAILHWSSRWLSAGLVLAWSHHRGRPWLPYRPRACLLPQIRSQHSSVSGSTSRGAQSWHLLDLSCSFQSKDWMEYRLTCRPVLSWASSHRSQSPGTSETLGSQTCCALGTLTRLRLKLSQNELWFYLLID